MTRASLPGRAPRAQVDCFLVEARDEWEPTLDWAYDAYRWCGLDEAVDVLRRPETADAPSTAC